MANTNNIPINGAINLIHLLYETSTISRVAKINPVGAIIAIQPCPKLYADTTTSLPRETVSASGAIIGIDKVASPDDEGMKIPKNENKIICTDENNTPFIPLIIFDAP